MRLRSQEHYLGGVIVSWQEYDTETGKKYDCVNPAAVGLTCDEYNAQQDAILKERIKRDPVIAEMLFRRAFHHTLQGVG